MHTAFELKRDMFSIHVEGKPTGMESLLSWGPQDRLGIIVHEAFGALGAGLLIESAITAFYDVPDRRRRSRTIYPDNFMLHVGGRWGAHTGLDFWPDHKEVFVPGEAQEVLRVINHLGITHLLCPDVPPRAATHRFKEPEAAYDRLKRCFAYSARWEVAAADVTIQTTSLEALHSFEAVLYDNGASDLQATPAGTAVRNITPANEQVFIHEYKRRRSTEVSATHPGRLAAISRTEQARRQGQLTQSFRRLEASTALDMLVTNSSAAVDA